MDVAFGAASVIATGNSASGAAVALGSTSSMEVETSTAGDAVGSKAGMKMASLKSLPR